MQQMRTERGGEIRLAGAGRSDPEHQRMRAHEIEIGGLRRRTGVSDTPRSRAERGRTKRGANRNRSRLAGNTNLGVVLRQVAGFAAFEPRIERAQYRGGALAPVGGALNRDEIAAHRDAHIELLFETNKVFLMRSGEARKQPVVGKFQSHLLLRRALRPDGTQWRIAL